MVFQYLETLFLIRKTESLNFLAYFRISTLVASLGRRQHDLATLSDEDEYLSADSCYHPYPLLSAAFQALFAIRRVLLAQHTAFPVSGADLYEELLSSTAILSTGNPR